ncbi:MAG: hypothetical protein IJU95_03275 [Treponema sp.]|nr:hypothetical protein [Treponema sp.]
MSIMFDDKRGKRLAFAVCGAVIFFALFFLLPPVQALFISAGERLKGRALNHEHWHRELSTVAVCVILFSSIIAALFRYAIRFKSLADMTASINERRTGSFFIAAVFFLLAFLGGFAYITSGHDWGDDFAEYILQGVSIADGTYATEHIGNGIFFIYPHGFPLLIAAVYKVFGLNLFAFKMISVVLYAAFVSIFFLFCDKRLKRLTAVTLAFLFAFSPCFYKLLDCILSDVSNLLFTFISLYLMSQFFMDDTSGRRKTLYSFAIGFFSFCAYICRDSGIVLPCTLAAMQVLHLAGRLSHVKKGGVDFRNILIHILPYIVFFALSFFVNDVLLACPERKQTDIFRSLSPVTVMTNCLYYFKVISYFFYPRFIWFAIFTAIAWAMVKFARQDGVLLVYFLGIMGLYIIWPTDQGIRYVASALPVLMFFAGRAVELLVGVEEFSGDARSSRPMFVFTWQSYVLLAALFCASSLSVCLVADARNCMSGRYLANGSYTKEAVEMYQYINDELSDDESIFFFKPRLLFMETGNVTVNYMSAPGQKMDMSFDYYLHTFDHGYGQLISDGQAQADSFDIEGCEFVCVHENASMKLFRKLQGNPWKPGLPSR